MLRVAVARLQALWSGCRVAVITTNPVLLARHCPDSVPVSGLGRHFWLRHASQPPEPPAWVNWSPSWARRWELVRLRRTQRRLLAGGPRSQAAGSQLGAFVDELVAADLVIGSGGGYLTDAFEDHATGVLRLLGTACRLGKPTALLGQGIGPISSPSLRAEARRVLPRVGLIAMREGRVGPSLVAGLGVPAERVVVTGDDAIELAAGVVVDSIPSAIGVNVRCAGYSGVTAVDTRRVVGALRLASARLSASLVALPVASSELDSDVAALAGWLPSDTDAAGDCSTVEALLDRVRQCRVVVTGSYHAGLFALAMGNPVVALSRSPYYDDKFLGLAHQFGAGCQVLRLDAPGFADDLVAAVCRGWRMGESERNALLAATEAQLRRSREAYLQIARLVPSGATA
jgi:colanic acid/amylovoran biosynthesis protein